MSISPTELIARATGVTVITNGLGAITRVATSEPVTSPSSTVEVTR